MYNKVDANPNFPQIEEKIIEKWKSEKIFEKSIKGDEDFVFYDGPPFANGLPHYGHLLTGFQKDVVGRYWTMKGKKVERRFGWDCHGLPAEMGAEKDLGISGKVAIENYGVEKFNAYCKESVLKYTSEWEYYVNRQARWVDFKNDYKTMDLNYMESVLWAFKQLYDKGLVYEALRVMPYSWACETPLSDFETRMDNSFREKVSKSVTVVFDLKSKPAKAPEGFGKYRMMAWTTTPWTLPSNQAVAIGKDLDYSLISHEGNCYIIASELLHKYEKEIGANEVGKIKGSDLLGLEYTPLFSYFIDIENGFKVLDGHHVTTEEGTGIVHMASGFGEDDFIICKENGIEPFCPIDSGAKFLHPVVDYIGQHVFDTNDDIIKRLKSQGNWIRTEQYVHNYPHCWRTDTPLIYRAIPSWYIKVTDYRDRMVQLNQNINWIPDHIKNGMFGKWIENARDWSISRNRYWGCPIPIWRSDDPQYPHIEVYGSVKEIEEAFGVKVTDLHKPFIDTLTKPNPKDPTGKSKLVRIPDVLDCWFESGSMPFAQVHYPFENKDWFETHFPADYIVEYKGQTRGWFYSLLALSTPLFDKHPFSNCNCHGVLLGDGGQKLSKRLKNYADPKEVFDTMGADAMRWFMLSSSVMKANDLVIDLQATGIREAVRRILKPIWNSYNFLVLYANADSVEGKFDLSSSNIMDKYILSKCAQSVEEIEKAMDSYDTVAATITIESFFEILNNWYIRRNRDRFWKSEKDADKLSAYNTLYSVLVTMCKATAPLLPLITEEIYINLVKGAESVHLELFPKLNYQIDTSLIQQMERVRDACTAALHIRNESGMRVRQPLAKVTFIGVSDQNLSDDLIKLILDEINVKTWENLDKSKIEQFANYKLQIKFPVVGKRIPTKVKDVIAAQKQNQWKLQNGKISIAGEDLLPEEFDLLLEPKAEFKDSICALPSNDALVLLDLQLTEELKLEGYARDIVRAIQQARKDAGLELTDRIDIAISSNDNDLKKAVEQWNTYILEQTLGTKIQPTLDSSASKADVEIEGITASVSIKKA